MASRHPLYAKGLACEAAVLSPRRQGAAPNSRKDSFTRRQYSARVLNKRVPRGRRPLGGCGQSPRPSAPAKRGDGEPPLPIRERNRHMGPEVLSPRPARLLSARRVNRTSSGGSRGKPQEGVPSKTISSNSRKVQPLRELPQRLFANRPESLRR